MQGGRSSCVFCSSQQRGSPWTILESNLECPLLPHLWLFPQQIKLRKSWISHSFCLWVTWDNFSLVLAYIVVVSVLRDASSSSALGHFRGFFPQLLFVVWETLIIYAHIMLIHFHGVLKDNEMFSHWRRTENLFVGKETQACVIPGDLHLLVDGHSSLGR